MADNFLEKRYEQLRSGKQVIRRSSPSLDSLLERLRDTPDAPTDPEYKVKRAQLDAIERSARILSGGFSSEVSEQTASIAISCKDMEELGGVLLAMRLKAAELRLHSETGTPAEGIPSAIISFYR